MMCIYTLNDGGGGVASPPAVVVSGAQLHHWLCSHLSPCNHIQPCNTLPALATPLFASYFPPPHHPGMLSQLPAEVDVEGHVKTVILNMIRKDPGGNSMREQAAYQEEGVEGTRGVVGVGVR